MYVCMYVYMYVCMQAVADGLDLHAVEEEPRRIEVHPERLHLHDARCLGVADLGLEIDEVDDVKVDDGNCGQVGRGVQGRVCRVAVHGRGEEPALASV